MPPFLRHLKGLRESRMDPRATEGLRGPEILPPAVADIIKPRTRLTSHSICLCHTLSGYRSPRIRERSSTNEQNSEATIFSLLHFRGPDRVQEILFRSGEYLLRSCHECKKANKSIVE
jgi:hypothetical protein